MTNKKKICFANIVIIICILVSTIVTASIIFEYHRLNTVVPSNVLSALFGFWGGELLIIAVRQIFGSDVTRKNTDNVIINQPAQITEQTIPDGERI